MVVGVCKVTLMVPESHSLKEKRMVLRRVKDRVANKFNCAIAEVGDQDAMFLPSGRIHAIGEGLILFEIQQNSDTTYRVFDWNRVGPDGKRRPLQPEQSIASINFNDFEPSLVVREKSPDPSLQVLVDDPLFRAELFRADTRKSMSLPEGKLHILGLSEGQVTISSDRLPLEMGKGQFCLIPASINAEIQIAAETSFLLVTPGE